MVLASKIVAEKHNNDQLILQHVEESGQGEVGECRWEVEWREGGKFGAFSSVIYSFYDITARCKYLNKHWVPNICCISHLERVHLHRLIVRSDGITIFPQLYRIKKKIDYYGEKIK